MDSTIESEELQCSVEKLQKTNNLLMRQCLTSCKETSSLKKENATIRTELEMTRDRLQAERESAKKERADREKEKGAFTQQLEAMKQSEEESNRVIASLQEFSKNAINNEKKKSDDLQKQLQSMKEKDVAREKDLGSLKEQTNQLTKTVEEQTREYGHSKQTMTTQIASLQEQLTASNALKETNSRLAQRNVSLEKELKEVIADDGGRKLSGSTEAYELVDVRKTRDRLLKEITLLRAVNEGDYQTNRTSPSDGIHVFFTVLEAAMLGKPLKDVPEAATKCIECGMSYCVSSEMVKGTCPFCQMLCKAIRLEKEAKERELLLDEERKETIRQCKRENQMELRKRDAIIAGLVLLFAVVIAIHLATDSCVCSRVALWVWKKQRITCSNRCSTQAWIWLADYPRMLLYVGRDSNPGRMAIACYPSCSRAEV